MRANRRSILIAILTFASLLGSAAGAAESPSSASPEPPPGVIISGQSKVKAKPPKSKPKPVRRALEARYEEAREAYRRKDPDTVIRMRTEDTFSITPSGQIWDAATIAQYIRSGFAQVETTLVPTFDIGTIDVKGDTAAANIDQHWVRRQQKAGAARLVDTRANQRETWVRRGGEWLLWRVDQVVPGAWIVDGKRIDPSQPYDPNAPRYKPREN